MSFQAAAFAKRRLAVVTREWPSTEVDALVPPEIAAVVKFGAALRALKQHRVFLRFVRHVLTINNDGCIDPATAAGLLHVGIGFLFSCELIHSGS